MSFDGEIWVARSLYDLYVYLLRQIIFLNAIKRDNIFEFRHCASRREERKKTLSLPHCHPCKGSCA